MSAFNNVQELKQHIEDSLKLKITEEAHPTLIGNLMDDIIDTLNSLSSTKEIQERDLTEGENTIPHTKESVNFVYQVLQWDSDETAYKAIEVNEIKRTTTNLYIFVGEFKAQCKIIIS